MIRLSLPWPPHELSPNKRLHWSKLAAAKRRYRDACYLATLAAKCRCPAGDRFELLLQFVPPDRRHYDRDNLVARLKSGLDGIAKALGINDRQFARVTAEIIEAAKPSRLTAEVRVTISAAALAPALIDGSTQLANVNANDSSKPVKRRTLRHPRPAPHRLQGVGRDLRQPRDLHEPKPSAVEERL